MNFFFSLAISLICASSLFAQDTFSIVAVDATTGEVGSAGASCISANNLQIYFPGSDPDFLGDLIPGLAAVNTQSSYLAQNQQAARNRLLAGENPQQVIDWLAVNDAQGNSAQRQYGIAAIINGSPQAAGFTGANCMNEKGHRTGSNYAIQGNILISETILDDMETAFLNTSGCLAEKLMAAMQAAKVPGADSRCLTNGTSSLFAFLKVAQQGDLANAPSVRIFVAYNPEGIEPIDSLQALFDALEPCLQSNSINSNPLIEFNVYPNPMNDKLYVSFSEITGPVNLRIYDAQGRLIKEKTAVYSGEAIHFSTLPGAYIIEIQDKEKRVASRIVMKN